MLRSIRPKRATFRLSEHSRCRGRHRLTNASLRAYYRRSLYIHGAFLFSEAALQNRRISRVRSGPLCPGARGCRREGVTPLATPRRITRHPSFRQRRCDGADEGDGLFGVRVGLA
jgi:hypothetical protein